MNQRIKHLRKEVLHLTQTEFAESIGLSQNYIFMIEKGDRDPSPRTIKDICRKYNVNEQWLLDGVGEMFMDLSIEDQIDAFIAKRRDLPEDAPQRRIMRMLAKLTPDDWETIANMIDSLIEDAQKNKDHQ